MTDGNEKKIVVNTPSEEKNRLLNMTAEEYHQYIREHPEEARREIAKYMANLDLSGLYAGIQESLKKLGDGLQAAAGNYTADVISKYIAESLQKWGRADAFLNAPEWLDAEALEKFYKEFDALGEYITAELARDPEGPHRTAAELLDAVDLESIYVAAEIDAHGEPQEEPEGPIKEEAQRLLKLVRRARAARDAKEKHLEIFSLQSPGTPKNFITSNTTLANALRGIDGRGELIGAGALDVPVMNLEKTNEITIYVDATMDEPIEGKPYTGYDEAVQGAITSIYADRTERGEPPIATAEMIYRTLTRKSANDFVSPQQKAAITKSIEKQGKIRMEVDFTNEATARGITVDDLPVESFSVEDTLLNYKKVKVKTGGRVYTAYHFDEPILYTHARINKQMITVPGAVLDIKEIDSKGRLTAVSISDTAQRIATKFYLLRRVEQMRNDETRAKDSHRREVNRCIADKKKGVQREARPLKAHRKLSRFILFESLFDAAEITSKNTRTAIKDYTYIVLENWKQGGRIKEWKKRKAGRRGSIDAVEIVL